MKKSGFTLAEVLITLGIIGVVAALTAPALVMSSRNEANAAKLSVTMSNLESAFSAMLVKENVDTLYDTQAYANAGSKAAFAGHLGQYLHTNGYKDLTGADGIKTYYGSNPQPAGLNSNAMRDEADISTADVRSVLGHADAKKNRVGTNHIIELKNGATVFITLTGNSNPTQATKNTIINAGGSLFSEAGNVAIDVNGVSGPNTIGRDIFYFYLGPDGILYPFGGTDVSIFDTSSHDTSAYWNSANSDYGCQDGAIKNSGFGCTARVIEEGYKINY